MRKSRKSSESDHNWTQRQRVAQLVAAQNDIEFYKQAIARRDVELVAWRQQFPFFRYSEAKQRIVMTTYEAPHGE